MARRSVAVVLRREGCVVKVAGGTGGALAILGTFPPRAVVADRVLRLMSGLVLAQHLRADPATRDVAQLAGTTFNRVAAERIAHEPGFVGYVQEQPLTLAEVAVEQLGGVS